MRQPDMVWMHVGHDDPKDGQTVQAVRKDLLPLGAGCSAVDAAIHDGPPVYQRAVCIWLSIAQQPQIDVIQCKG